MLVKKTWMLAMAVTVAASGAVAVGCGNGDDTATAPPKDGGTSDVVTADGASGGDAGPSDGGGESAATTLYERLGGHAGIRAAVDLVVAAELMDPDIASYFFNQGPPVAAGHPTGNQISECFTDLLAQAANGPETYPPDGGVFDDAAAPDASVWQCRDLATIHQTQNDGGLHISGPTFDKFIMIAAGVVQPVVSPADFTAIAGVLEGTKGAIVDPNLPDSGDAGPYSADAP
jgi:hypothetical protein